MLPDRCDVTPEPCCGDLYAIADHLLTSVFDALKECMGDQGCSMQIVAYVTAGTGDDGVRDALTVEFDGIVPTTRSVQGGNGLLVSRATYTVRLRESGWPIVRREDGTVVVPPPDEQNHAAKYALARGELVYRWLLGMQAQKQIVPTSVMGCPATQVRDFRPMRPSGGVIGWTVTVDVDLPWGF